MLWLLTIPFALGILLHSQMAIAVGWLVAILLLCLLVMLLFYHRKQNIVPLLIINSLLTGALYGHVRQGLADTDPTSQGITTTTYQSTTYGTSGSSSHKSTLTVPALPQLSTPHQALLSAMLLGNRSALSKEQKTSYRQAGAQHLLALSGMHLGIFLTLITLLILRHVRFSRWRWPVLLLTLAALWYYAIVVGMPKSLLRAILMATLFLTGRFMMRPTRGHEVLACTILIMLLADPLCLFDIGAQLSIAALVGLTCFYPTLCTLIEPQEPDTQPLRPSYSNGVQDCLGMRSCLDKRSWLGMRSCLGLRSCLGMRGCLGMRDFLKRCMKGVLRFFFISLSAWLFTMPLVAYHFEQFQVWQPLTGVFLVPLTSLMLYVAVLVFSLHGAGLTFLVTPLATLLNKLMNVQDAAIQFSASLPMASIRTAHLNLWQVSLFYLLLATVWVMMRYRSIKVILYATATCAMIIGLMMN